MALSAPRFNAKGTLNQFELDPYPHPLVGYLGKGSWVPDVGFKRPGTRGAGLAV